MLCQSVSNAFGSLVCAFSLKAPATSNLCNPAVLQRPSATYDVVRDEVCDFKQVSNGKALNLSTELEFGELLDRSAHNREGLEEYVRP